MDAHGQAYVPSMFPWQGPRSVACCSPESFAAPNIRRASRPALSNLAEVFASTRPRKSERIGQGSVAWTLEHTDERSKRFMRDLPFDLRFALAGKRIRLVHGSPRTVNECLLEDRPASSFERIAQLADSDVLLFGHTYTPWARALICSRENLRTPQEPLAPEPRMAQWSPAAHAQACALTLTQSHSLAHLGFPSQVVDVFHRFEAESTIVEPFMTAMLSLAPAWKGNVVTKLPARASRVKVPRFSPPPASTPP
jgi:hypothetical protein